VKTLAAYFRKILQPVDPHIKSSASLPTLCWYCARQLPAIFTTVNGYRVHPGCRHGTVLVLAIRNRGAVVQEVPDYEDKYPIG